MANNKFENIMSAIDYIEENLTEKINLDAIAEGVHYSKYHLHRVFTNTVACSTSLPQEPCIGLRCCTRGDHPAVSRPNLYFK